MQTNTNITLRREGALGYQPAHLIRSLASAPASWCSCLLVSATASDDSVLPYLPLAKREEHLEHLGMGQRRPNNDVIGFGPFAFGPFAFELSSDIGADEEAMDRAAEKGPT